MTQPIIRVENLSKVYRIGLRDEMPDTMVTALTGLVRKPWQNFQQLRRLGKFRDDEEHADMLWALRDVSFEVNEGEVVGIIGRNGAGKSTLLKILSRITEPSTGRAVLNGRVSSLLEVGTGFHPELTGRENIYMNGTILGMRKREIDSKFDEIVDFSGVEKFLDTPSKRYSSGMKVRLAFAVAAHLEPEILIIDEVLAVGDAEFQKKCLGKMKDVASSGRTVLFVSHNMAAVENLCQRIIVMDKGTNSFEGKVADGIAAYFASTLLEQSDELENGKLISRKREKDFFPILKEVQVFDSSGKQTCDIQAGSSIKIRLLYSSETIFEQPRFGIAVEDRHGQRLIFFQTDLQYGQCPDLPKEGEVTCSVDCLPLTPGNYFLSLGCASKGVQTDKVQHAIELRVHESDFFGTGKLPSHSNGLFLVNAKWEVPLVTLETDKCEH